MGRYYKLLWVRTLNKKFEFYSHIKEKRLKMFFSVILLPFAIREMFHVKKRFIIPYVEIVVTEKCTLRCEACANLIQYYESAVNYSYEQIKSDIEELERAVERVYVCQVLGGEPFLNAELHRILKLLNSKTFIEKVQVVTNATIIPPNGVLECLKEKKNTVLLSNYGNQSGKLKELIEVFLDNKIAFECLNYNNWIDYGDLSYKNLTQEDLVKSYRVCASAECKTLMHGKLYTCPRSAHMHNLGLLSNEKEVLNLYDKSITKKQWIAFYQQKYTQACKYCDPECMRALIPPAKQLNRKLHNTEKS